MKFDEFSFYRWLLALIIGAAGGALFHLLQVPLAWMLGAMTFTMIASLQRLPLAIPTRLRSLAQVMLGIFLGTSFSPETATRIVDWPLSLGALIVFTVTATVLAMGYYRRLGGFDPVTALFSATPGGMSAMIFLGGDSGGDERKIALAQSLRVVLVVFLIPPLVIARVPGASVDESAMIVSAQPVDFFEVIILFLGAVIGIETARFLRLPVPQISGTMTVTAVLSLTGAVAVDLPPWLLEVTLWILGTSVGVRFVGVTVRDLLSTGRYILGAAALMLLLTAIFAAVISSWLDVGYWAAFLAFAPGGVAEMCTIAMALNIDPTFVAFHHLFRIFFILLMIPWVGRWASKR